MQPSTMMQMAYLVGQSSKCVSWKVGAIIVKNGRVISTGYNGTPEGQCNCNEHAERMCWMDNSYHANMLIRAIKPQYRNAHSEWSSKNEIHAELNAILFAARNGVSIDGATMYVTVSPCAQCAKSIAQSGIKRVVYRELYDRNSADWEEIMRDAGIEVIQLNDALDMLNPKTVFSNQSLESKINAKSGKNMF